MCVCECRDRPVEVNDPPPGALSGAGASVRACCGPRGYSEPERAAMSPLPAKEWSAKFACRLFQPSRRSQSFQYFLSQISGFTRARLRGLKRVSLRRNTENCRLFGPPRISTNRTSSVKRHPKASQTCEFIYDPFTSRRTCWAIITYGGGGYRPMCVDSGRPRQIVLATGGQEQSSAD